MRVNQVNLQPKFGGGEVYTAFLCRALSRLGVPTRLFAHPAADFWTNLGLPDDTEIVRAESPAAVAAGLGDARWILGHGPLPAAILEAGRGRGPLTAIAHMPLFGRNPRSFDGHDMVFPVSGWVLETLRSAGASAWPEALYGVADLAQRKPSGRIRQRSRYDWDRRKFRDRLLGLAEPLLDPFLPHPEFVRRPGLSLGIVSRLTPIKQFPQLFTELAPILAARPEVTLEIFGSGGYASVRDLERALAPLGQRARFWGHQADVATIYGQLDYLLAGLPEKEALGLNIIEAQACDLPVIAVRAPPFTETIADGTTGHLYDDPRQDKGADFGRLLTCLLTRLLDAGERLHPVQAHAHLARFSFDAFVARIAPIVDWARTWKAARTP